MSGAPASSNANTAMASNNDSGHAGDTEDHQKNKPRGQLEEDDEFEDFPVEDWGAEGTDAVEPEQNQHLWEESWDDDDTSDDFSKQLQEEIKKVDSGKR